MALDREIARYYRSLIPKWIQTALPRYDPHITVVRPEKDLVDEGTLHNYDGREVQFLYAAELQQSRNYLWLPAYSEQLEQIRLELGLPVVNNSDLVPPDGCRKPFHITIANLLT